MFPLDRAWEFSKPLLFCPAMNTNMWLHPVTQDQVRILKEWGYTIIPCVEKQLVCGDTGVGAMANIDTIVTTALKESSNVSKKKGHSTEAGSCALADSLREECADTSD